MTIKAFTVAQALDRLLGDERQDSSVWSLADALAADRSAHFPDAIVQALHDFGLPRHYIPLQHGGQFESAMSLFAIAQVLARRDLSLTVHISPMIWSVVVWQSGTLVQQRAMASHLLKGCYPALAYSERQQGADLLNNKTVIEPIHGEEATAPSWRLTGEKWPINRATLGHSWIVLTTHHDSAQHPGRQTLLWLDRSQTSPDHWRPLERVLTHGLKACDISGIAFSDLPVDLSQVVGQVGQGLVHALCGLQFTRTACAPLASGALDGLLRCAVSYLSTRQLYQQPALRIPVIAHELVQVARLLLLQESTQWIAARALHVYPERFCTWSLLVKVLAARCLESGGQLLKAMMGARFYMASAHDHAPFEKLLRDSQVISVFDGSSAVCLDGLAVQFEGLWDRHLQAVPLTELQARSLFAMDDQLPDLNWSAFRACGRHSDPVLDAWPVLKSGLLIHDQEAGNRSIAEQVIESIQTRFDQIGCALAHRQACPPIRQPGVGHKSCDMNLLVLTQQYIELHAKLCVIGAWAFNPSADNTLRLDLSDVLACVVDLSIWPLGMTPNPQGSDSQIVDRLMSMTQMRRMFSQFDWPLPCQ